MCSGVICVFRVEAGQAGSKDGDKMLHLHCFFRHSGCLREVSEGWGKFGGELRGVESGWMDGWMLLI